MWAQVYNPYNPDLTYDIASSDFGPEQLGPLDQKRFEFFVGQGKLKKYRNFTGEISEAAGGVRVVARQITGGSRLLRLQQALRILEFDVDVDGLEGPKTTQAIREYQIAHNMEVTGVLSDSVADAVIQKAATRTPPTFVGALNGGAQGAATKVDIYIVIDPHNVIRESNEANNIQKWVVNIDCAIDDDAAMVGDSSK